MEYAIKEHNGKFYPGVWVTEMKGERWFKKKQPVRTFQRLNIYGWPFRYCMYVPTPPPKRPFESLSDAELWLYEKLNPEPNKEPIYHAYGK